MAGKEIKGLSRYKSTIRDDVFNVREYVWFLNNVNQKNFKNVEMVFKNIFDIFDQYEKARNFSRNSSIENFTELLLNNYNDFFKSEFENGKIAQEIFEAIGKEYKVPKNKTKTKEQIESLIDKERISLEIEKLREGLLTNPPKTTETDKNKSLNSQKITSTKEIIGQFIEVYKTYIAHYINIWARDVFEDLKSLIEDCFKLASRRFKEEIVGLIEDGYEYAKKTSKELKEKDNLKQLRKELERQQKTDKNELSKWEQKYQHHREKRIDRYLKNVKEMKSAGKTLTGVLIKNLTSNKRKNSEFGFILNSIENTRLNFAMKLSQKKHEKQKSFSKLISVKNGELRFFRGTRIHHDWKKSKYKGANTLLSIGISKALFPVVKHHEQIGNTLKKSKQLISSGFKLVKKTVLFIPKMIKNVIGFGFRTIKNILLSPFMIIGKIKQILNKPLVKNFIEFIKTDVGAMFLGTAAAFIKVFIFDPLKEWKKHITQEYNLPLLESAFITEWLAFAKNPIKSFKSGQIQHNSDKTLLSEYKSKRNSIIEYNKKNKLKAPTFQYSVLIWLLEWNDRLKSYMMDGNSDKKEDGESDQKKTNQVKNSGFQQARTVEEFQNKLTEIIRNSKKKLAEITGNDLNLDELVRKLCGGAADSMENISRAMTGFAVSFGASTLGSIAGGLLGGPLGAVVGGVVGTFIGKGINFLREKAHARQDAIKYATQHLRNIGSEREAMTRRYTELENAKVKRNPDKSKWTEEQKQQYEKEDLEYERLKSMGALSIAERDRLTTLRDRCVSDIADVNNYKKSVDGNREYRVSKENNMIRSLSEDSLHDKSLSSKSNAIKQYLKINEDDDENLKNRKLQILHQYKEVVAGNMLNLINMYNSDDMISYVSLDDIFKSQEYYTNWLYEWIQKNKEYVISKDENPGTYGKQMTFDAKTDRNEEYVRKQLENPYRKIDFGSNQLSNRIEFADNTIAIPLDAYYRKFLYSNGGSTREIRDFSDFPDIQKNLILQEIEKRKNRFMENQLNQFQDRICRELNIPHYDMFLSGVDVQNATMAKQILFEKMKFNKDFFQTANLFQFLHIMAAVDTHRAKMIMDGLKSRFSKRKMELSQISNGSMNAQKDLDNINIAIDGLEKVAVSEEIELRKIPLTPQTTAKMNEDKKFVSDIIEGLGSFNPTVHKELIPNKDKVENSATKEENAQGIDYLYSEDYRNRKNNP